MGGKRDGFGLNVEEMQCEYRLGIPECELQFCFFAALTVRNRIRCLCKNVLVCLPEIIVSRRLVLVNVSLYEHTSLCENSFTPKPTHVRVCVCVFECVSSVRPYVSANSHFPVSMQRGQYQLKLNPSIYPSHSSFPPFPSHHPSNRVKN